MAIHQVLSLIILVVSWNGMAHAITCPSSGSNLNEADRDKILATMNRDRELIRRGELLLSNGQYALQGAFMKNLTWDCATEARVAMSLEAVCINGTSGPYPVRGGIITKMGIETALDVQLDLWISTSPLFNASTFLQLSNDTLLKSWNHDFLTSYLYDKSLTVGCAMYHCGPRNHRSYSNLTKLMCTTTPNIALYEQIYIPGDPAIVTTPTPPSCSVPNSLLSPANRQTITTNLNKIRAQIENGTFLLNNGKYALPAENMPMLIWDCELEAAMQANISNRCIYGYPSLNNFTTFNGLDNWNTIDYYVHELSQPDATYLTFLSNSTIGRSNFKDIQRILHDKATKIGCAIHQCFRQFKQMPLTTLSCTFDVNWQFYQTIYNERSNTTTTTTPTPTPTTTTTALPTTQECSNENENIDKTKALLLIEGKETLVASGMLLGFIETGIMNPSVLDFAEFAVHKAVLTALGLLD